MSNPVIEKFSTLLPRNGQGKRVMKSKLLTALGATGVLAPFPANPEHILERKILLQNTFSPGGGGPPPPVGNRLLIGLQSYWVLDDPANGTRVDKQALGNLTDHLGDIPQQLTANGINGQTGAGPFAQINGAGLQSAGVYNLVIGDSFTFNGWLHPGNINTTVWLDFDNGVNGCAAIFMNGGTPTAYVFDNGVTEMDMVFAFNQNNWQMWTLGFDFSTKLGFFSINAGARQTVALTTGVVNAGAKVTMFNSTSFADFTPVSIQQDWGYWKRALSTADVTTLYNGGVGIPYSSFQNF